MRTKFTFSHNYCLKLILIFLLLNSTVLGEAYTTTDSGTDYKKIPNFKTDKKLVKNFGESPQRIENYFNGLNESLKNYILGKKKKDDW